VYAFGTLVVMLLVVNSIIVGVIGGLLPATVLADGYDPAISVVLGVVVTVLFVLGTGLWMYRLTRDFPARLVTVVPAPRAPTNPDEPRRTATD
jgi:amino acid transporter